MIIDDDVKIDNIYIGDDGLFNEKNIKQGSREFIICRNWQFDT